jgi:hypothetical protein
MIKSKKKYRNLQVARRPKSKATGTRELVLTLSIPDGEVVKVETPEKSGQRHELSEEEFAALAGEDEAEDISPEEATQRVSPTGPGTDSSLMRTGTTKRRSSDPSFGKW